MAHINEILFQHFIFKTAEPNSVIDEKIKRELTNKIRVRRISYLGYIEGKGKYGLLQPNYKKLKTG